MFISEKCINFAVVIELNRHIEILLLDNDCVIVPDLGGFMAHHAEARFDERDNMFLPPLRALGFNAQLKINDSLLAQSYIEAYDISYPEAINRIAGEVNELKHHIQNNGYYELNGIGTLSLNDDGRYIFSPCEAGILTPSLYGLGTFEFPMLSKMNPAVDTHQTIDTDTKVPLKTVDSDDDDDGDDKALVIKLSWIRNAVAVAAAVLAFFLMTTPISNSESTNMATANLNTVFFDTAKKTTASKTEITNDSIKSAISKTLEAKKDTIAPRPVTTYCIVLASYVSKKNANAFVEQLHKQGFVDSEVYIRNNVTRVIYGNFRTVNDAYNRLNRMRGNKDFEEAWVLKTTDRG